MKSTIIVLLFFFLFSGYESEAQLIRSHDPLLEARKAIEESNAIYFTSFQKNDPSIFVERYAVDACIFAPGTPKICGHDEVRKFFEGAYRDHGLRNGKFITTAIYGDGKEFVTEEGIWQSFDKDAKLFDQGKFLVVWKKTDSVWKMFRDSFSSDRQNLEE